MGIIWVGEIYVSPPPAADTNFSDCDFISGIPLVRTKETEKSEKWLVEMSKKGKKPGGGGTLGFSGWGCAAGTLEPLTYTRASSAEFCHPILE